MITTFILNISRTIIKQRVKMNQINKTLSINGLLLYPPTTLNLTIIAVFFRLTFVSNLINYLTIS